MRPKDLYPEQPNVRQENAPRPNSQHGKRPQTANLKARYHVESDYGLGGSQVVASKKEVIENQRHKKSASK